jgi:arylsulfatase A-like enzyme
MKAIMVMFDSLNRHMLPPYGCDWVHAPNFKRLAKQTVTFDKAYMGSAPCMPARRDLHTGRYNFLHRGWGPLEPFDDSMPEILKSKGVYTHLVSDHFHYWEDGGSTYHNRYSSWEISRGQEGDPWKGHVHGPDIPNNVIEKRASFWRQDRVNRMYMMEERDQPQAKTFALGLEFIRTNYEHDNWFLQIETFDPHEPFFTPQKYKELYPHTYSGPEDDWPDYGRVGGNDELVQHYRYEYAALLSMCDVYLGQVLDIMEELNLWEDTMLIVNTDHGFSLGEHGWLGKSVQPYYNEVAHLPLFIWDPRSKRKNARCENFVQTIDIGPTLLEFFGVEIPKDMQGVPLRSAIADQGNTRQAGLFGVHGGQVNCTDGRYVYMRASEDGGDLQLYHYTLMPTHMKSLFDVSELQDAELAPPFSFTKGCPLLKIGSRPGGASSQDKTLLFDLRNDPGQEHPMRNPAIEHIMLEKLVKLMKENEAPLEQYHRLGL